MVFLHLTLLNLSPNLVTLKLIRHGMFICEKLVKTKINTQVISSVVIISKTCLSWTIIDIECQVWEQMIKLKSLELCDECKCQ